MQKTYWLFALIVLIIAADSCTKRTAAPEKEEPKGGCSATYKDVIKPLVLQKCATSNCHTGNFPFGNFTAYGDLKTRIDNGRVKTLVFDQKLMPPAGSPQLSREELDKLKCWIDNGSQEN